MTRTDTDTGYNFRIARHGTYGAQATRTDTGIVVTFGHFRDAGFVADAEQPESEDYRTRDSVYGATLLVSKMRARYFAA